MRVLSVGEKIKQCRKFKGIKLKDISDKNLSISKISCIENGKIIPDKHTIKLLAQKLGITYKYLSSDIRDQVLENILNMDNLKDISSYMYNLEMCIKYEIYDLSFIICSKIFNIYIGRFDCKEDLDDILYIIPYYFDSLIKSNERKNIFLYNFDLGNYFFIKKNYNMSSYYFYTIRKIINKNDYLFKFKNIIFKNEVFSYIKSKNYVKLYDLKNKILKHFNDSKIGSLKNIFGYFYIIWVIKYDIKNFNMDLIFEYIKCDCDFDKLSFYYDICIVLCDFKFENKALFLAKEMHGIILTKEIYFNNGDFKINLLNIIIYIFIKNSLFEDIEIYLDEALDMAIYTKNDHLIHRSYYNKVIYYEVIGDNKKLENCMELYNHFSNRVKNSMYDEGIFNKKYLYYGVLDIYSYLDSIK